MKNWISKTDKIKKKSENDFWREAWRKKKTSKTENEVKLNKEELGILKVIMK